VYDAKGLEKLSPRHRERYFVEKEGVLQVAPIIRQMVVFAPHNLLRDVPFNRLDLVTCRNLLIYLEHSAQRRALSTFHFALKHRGMLFLGPSESLADLNEAFETVDTHWKVFRKATAARVAPAFASDEMPVLRARPPALLPLMTGRLPDPGIVGTYDAVLDAVMPPSLLVGARRNLVQSFGGASRFLRVPEGRATDDVIEMLGADLRVALTGAINRGLGDPQPVRYRDLRPAPDSDTLVDLTVRQVKNARTGDLYALVTFDEQRAAPAHEPSAEPIASDTLTRDRIEGLETELRHAKENLQTTIEELETSNEELQATNEELMASNEELQTTNEELHSVNQELFTVNAEFHKKITELTQLNNDMDHLLASTEVHTLFLDKELRVRRFTPQIAKVWNLVPSDVGRRIDAFNHGLSRTELYEDLRRVVATGKGVEEQVHDAEHAWFLLRILPYKRDAVVEGAVLTLVDITGMKKLEARARDTNDLLSNILTNSPHPVFVRDRDGRYVVADESFRRIANRDPAGLRPEQVFSLDVATMITRDDSRILTEGVTVESEETLPTPDGARTYLSVKFPMRDADGEIMGIGGIQTDVTTLKRAEAEARDAASRRDRFLATLSHELRNPLAAVLNAARIVTRAPLEQEEQMRWHRTILERAQHMARLVDDLLDVARLTQDKLVLHCEHLDLAAASRGVTDEIGELFRERGIQLRVEVPGEPIAVMGDLTRLHQVQVNLLTNAARHTPRGGTVTFRVCRAGADAEIVVSDTGEGIAPDMLERVFELFVQGDKPGARGADQGLGVGLALVRRIVQLHDGNVTVTSKGGGQGAEFRVRIPLVATQAVAPSVQDATPVADAAPPDKPRTVLLVDDDASTRNAMRKLLQMDDVEVTAVADGPKALETLAAGDVPDLVLLDIGLPEMDGYEVCRRMRATAKGEHVLAFALTGFGQDSDRDAAKAAGFDAHLTKPVDVDQIYELYARLLPSAPRS
jgi:two-component system CheB/CheR fusion protein